MSDENETTAAAAAAAVGGFYIHICPSSHMTDQHRQRTEGYMHNSTKITTEIVHN